jgi:uncharacterized protein (TIGR03437 family)
VAALDDRVHHGTVAQEVGRETSADDREPRALGCTLAGIAAPTSSWSDTRIVAYVPEGTALGTVALTVTTDGGATASATLSVTDRPPADK